MIMHTLIRSSVLLLAAVAMTPAVLARAPAKHGPLPTPGEVEPIPLDYTVTSRPLITSHDAVQGGCLTAATPSGCSQFASMRDVYVSAGPEGDRGLEDGEYFFAVLAPGYQKGAFVDGVDGNLSDQVAGSTVGDDGDGDTVHNRTFTVTNHQITGYEGKHAEGRSADGRLLIAAAPFDEGPNRGNVYVLAVCKSGATLYQQCRFDAFQIGQDVSPMRAVVAGLSYYDANANGMHEPDEPGMHSGTILYWDGDQGVVPVAMDGTFSALVAPDELLFAARPLGGAWIRTGNTTSQAVLIGDASLVLQKDGTYDLTVEAASAIDGVQFGNVCLGGGGSRGRGYWASQVSLPDYGPDALDLLRRLHLRGSTGLPYDPASVGEFQKWLRGESTANQVTQLSAQLAVAALNVQNGFVNGEDLALMEGTDSADGVGLGQVQQLIAEADDALTQRGMVLPGDDGQYATREALLRALSSVNGNTAFVQPNQLSCMPVFTTPEGLERGAGRR